MKIHGGPEYLRKKKKKQLISKFVRTELAEIFFHTVGILLN